MAVHPSHPPPGSQALRRRRQALASLGGWFVHALCTYPAHGNACVRLPFFFGGAKGDCRVVGVCGWCSCVVGVVGVGERNKRLSSTKYPTVFAIGTGREALVALLQLACFVLFICEFASLFSAAIAACP